jgi:hypothetical protein
MGSDSTRLVRIGEKDVRAVARAATILESVPLDDGVAGDERKSMVRALRAIVDGYAHQRDASAFAEAPEREPRDVSQGVAPKLEKDDPGSLGRARPLILGASQAAPVARILAYDVAELDVPERVLKTLVGLGARTLGDVVRLKPSHLLSQPGFGRQSLVRVSGALADFGLALSPDKSGAGVYVTPTRRV